MSSCSSRRRGRLWLVLRYQPTILARKIEFEGLESKPPKSPDLSVGNRREPAGTVACVLAAVLWKPTGTSSEAVWRG